MDYCREDLTSETLDCFRELNLVEFDDNWINEQYSNEFTDVTDYENDIERVFESDIYDTIMKVTLACEKWTKTPTTPNRPAGDEAVTEIEDAATSENDDGIILWQLLQDNGIDVEKLVGLICLFCSRCVKPSASLFERRNGLACSKLYFVFLLIQGSTAYSIFHVCLYRMAINCLKMPKENEKGKARPPTSAYRNDIVSQRKRVNRDKGACSRSTDQDYEEEDEDADSITEHEETFFSSRDCELLKSCFPDVLKALVNLLNGFSLGKDVEVIELTVQKLVECASYESHNAQLDFDCDINRVVSFQRKYGISYITTLLAYKGLLAICRPLHGDEENIYMIVLKHLMDHILCSKAKSQSPSTIAHKYLVIKDNAVSFVCYNLKTNQRQSSLASHVLVQQLCTRVTDKVDFRAKVADAVVTILKEFSLDRYVNMKKWLLVFVSQTKIQNRLCALEIISLLLQENQRIVTEEFSEELLPFTTQVPLANAIIEKCYDKASSVRTKALSLLALNIEKILAIIKQEIKDKLLLSKSKESQKEKNQLDSSVEGEQSILSSPENKETENHCEDEEGAVASPPEVVETEHCREDEQSIISVLEDEETEYRRKINEIIEMLHCRSDDIAVGARKAALQVLEKLICVDNVYLTEANYNLFFKATSDPNITIRKQAIISATALLQTYHHQVQIQNFWLLCVLPLTLDSEKSIYSKALEVMEEEFLNNIYSAKHNKQQHVWDMVKKVSSAHNEQQRYLQKAFKLWKDEGKLKPKLYSVLEAFVGTEHDSAAWFLLSLLAPNIELRNTTFIVNYWESSKQNDVPNSTMLYVLKIISCTCKHMDVDKLTVMQDKLESEMINFECPASLIAASIDTLFQIYNRIHKKEEICKKMRLEFAEKVLKISETYLSSILLESNSVEVICDDLINKHLFTIGELAQLCPASLPNKILLIIQSLIASSSSSKHDGRYNEASSKIGRISGLSSHSEKSFSPAIQAHAFVALGKLCLQNEDLTKKCIPALARELMTSKHFEIRTNVVVVMVDLCTRYTLLVDQYIPTISSCLKDCNASVRYQTIILLTRLLQQDYIKWKGTLFYRMISAVMDEDKTIRSFAKYCLGHLLPKRQEAIFVQHFIESIFYFNGSSGPNLKFVSTSTDQKLFSLKGKQNEDKRMLLYTFMVKRTHPPLRIRLVHKLCQDILGGVADNVIVLDEENESVVRDCLAVLNCEEIKLPNMAPNGAEETDESEAAANVIVKTISQAQRLVLVQHIVPIVISLKRVLEELKSSLLNDLMLYLRGLLKNYKNELKDILSADKHLAAEIEFDIRRSEKLQAQKEAEDKENQVAASSLETPSSRQTDKEMLLRSATKAARVFNSLSTTPIQTLRNANSSRVSSANQSENA